MSVRVLDHPSFSLSHVSILLRKIFCLSHVFTLRTLRFGFTHQPLRIGLYASDFTHRTLRIGLYASAKQTWHAHITLRIGLTLRFGINHNTSKHRFGFTHRLHTSALRTGFTHRLNASASRISLTHRHNKPDIGSGSANGRARPAHMGIDGVPGTRWA